MVLDFSNKTLGIFMVALFLTLLAASVAFGEGQQEEPAPADSVDDQDVVEITSRRGDEFTFVFDPVGVHIEPGTTVRFVVDEASHTATAYHPDNGKNLRIPEGAEPWDSGTMAPGDVYEVELTEEGVYDYYCEPHEHLGHVGRIVVGDPDESPAVDPSDLPGDAPDAIPSVEETVENGYVPAN